MKESTQTKVGIGIIIGIVIIIILLFLGLINFQEDGWARLAGHLYPGDHITLDMKLKLNGADIPLSDLKITCDFNGEAQDISLKNESIKTHGGHYGCYYFHITIPAKSNDEEDFVFNVEYFNANNWYIVTHQCDIELISSENGVTGTLDAVSEYNNGLKEILTRSFTKDDDGMLYVRWGL